MKMFCYSEIENAIENSQKYDLTTLLAMRAQMLRHENYLKKEYQFFAEELTGVAHASMKAEMLSDQLREHEKNMRKMDAHIARLEAQ